MTNPYDAIIDSDLNDEQSQPANPYDAAIDRDLKSLDTLRAQSSMRAAKTDPGRELEVRQTADRLGIAPDLLRENLDEAKFSLKSKDLQDAVSQFSNPSQQFLLENDNLGVLQEDLPRLKALEEALLNREQFEAERLARERGFFGNTARGVGERGLDLFSNLMEFANNIANEGEAFIQEQGVPNPGASYGTLDEFESRGRTPDFTIGNYGIEFRGDIPAEETDGIQPVADAVDQELGYQPYFTSDRIKEDITAGNIAGFIGEQGLISIPDMLGAVFATPAYVASRTEEIAEQRVINDGGEGQPGISELAAAAPAAAASALIERFAAIRLFNPRTTTIAGTIGAGIAREAGTEFVQEQIEYAGETVGTQTPFNITESLERGAWGALAGGGMGGGIATVQQIYSRATGYNRARRDREYLKKVGEAANESETDKQVLRDMIARAKQTGPVSEVYVDANEFRTLFQSAGLDPDAIAERMPSVTEQYYESAAIGGDIAISLEDYATVIAETAANEQFLEIARTEQSGMSSAEAQQWYDEQAKPMIDAAMQYDPAAENPGGERVSQDVIGQLLGTGMDQATAERNASLYKAFFSVLGQYEGRDPYELFQEYGLSINREQPEILQRGRQVDEFDNLLSRLRAGEIPTAQEIDGPSLARFLRDQGGLIDDGGELSAMDVDAVRQPFERRLIQEAGLSLDAAAELAVEAGYLSERDPNALLELINNELRGNPVYSPANANDELRTLAADLIELDEALRQSGYDIQAMSNEEIREAIMGGQPSPAGEVEFDQQSDDILEQLLAEFDDLVERGVIDEIQSERSATPPAELVARFIDRSGLGGIAAWSPERLSRVIQENQHVNGEESRARVAFVNPADFVNATSVDSQAIQDEAGELDVGRLAGQEQTPYLRYSNGEIVGHEGRHRMAALAAAGIDRVPVVVYSMDGYLSHADAPGESSPVSLSGQQYQDGTGQTIRADESYLLTEADRPAIEEAMGSQDAQVLFQRQSKGPIRVYEYEDRDSAPVGAWVKDGHQGMNGTPVSQVRMLDLDSLYLPELRDDGQLAEEKRPYVEEYAGRIRAGDEAPPIFVVEMDDGRMRVVDGHRRAMAASQAGSKQIKAIVSPAVEVTAEQIQSSAQDVEVTEAESPFAEVFSGGLRLQTENGVIDVVQPDGAPYDNSIVNFVVDEDARGTGQGGALLDAAVERYGDSLGGAFSSEASVAAAYNRGFRGLGDNAGLSLQELQDVRSEQSSVTMKYNPDFNPVLFQPGTDAFSNWFGDSKIVDENAPAEDTGITVDEVTDNAAIREIFARYQRGQGQGRKEPGRTVGGGQADQSWRDATSIRGADGQPARLYRGAARGLTAEDFGPDALGQATGNPSAALGVWFTNSQDDASRYGSVQEFFADIRNPAVYSTDEVPAFDSAEQAAAFREQLQSEGYDGIVFDYTDVGGQQHFVAFAPEQVIQPDTVQLNQSDSEPRDLFVAHNITAPGILAANDLGGLAAPSIAVARAGVSNFDNYGEITLLADPSLLESAKVRTFDADVYSPRQPRPEYELNTKKLRDIQSRIDALPGGQSLSFPDPESLSRDPNAMLYSDGAKMLFLEEQGKAPKLRKAKVEPWVRKAAKWGKSRYELRDDQRFQNLVLDETKKHLEELREADPVVAERYESRMIERDENGNEEVTFHILSDRASKVESFVVNDGMDPSQLKHDIAKKFRTKKTQADFEKWARDTFNEMVDGKKLFKGFSPAGNRRYSDYTLNNVVREMTRELQGGENFNYGAGSVRSSFAREMKRISDVQARREQIVTPEEFEAVKEESQQRVIETLDALRPYYKFDAEGFGYLDDASSAIAEGRRGQAEAFELNDESRAIIDDLTSYLRGLPTEYFEAKAQRAVDFSEFSIAVVPKGVDRDALKVLRDAGLKVKYYDGSQDGDRARVIGEQEKVLFQSDRRNTPRGRINIDRANQNFNIELLEGADLSTFLHETGHYFLEVIGAIASDPAASERTQKIYQDTLKWMGVDSQEQIGTEQHELFARTFEAYLRDGKAPSPELQPMFQRFAAWLRQIYRSLLQLNANLTDEVRSVFDRMLATDQEIEQAQEEAGYLVRLMDVEGIEWTDDERQRLAELRESARSQAEAELMAEQMKDLTKAQQEWWAKEKAVVRQEMLDSLNALPQYQARQMLTAGKRANGDALPEGVEQIKLNKQALVDEFGAEFLKELPSPRNPNNKAPQYVYSREGGEDPSVVARTYGYSSVRAMVNDLIASRPVNEYVDALTDSEMRARYPDINLSGQAAEIAKESVYNDKQAQLMLLELKKLEGMVGRKQTIPRVMRQKAAEMVAGMKVRDIRPDLYSRKTSKYGREAFDAAARGQMDRAILAKQRELMHHYLYKESQKAREESEKVYQYAKRIQKKAAQERIGKAGGDYLERINEILEKYEFRRVSNKELDRRQSLAEWLKGREADGEHVDVPEEVIARSQRVNWRDVPLEELQAARDAVRNLEYIARNKNRMLADKDKRDLEEVLRPVVDQVLSHGDKAGRGFFERDTLMKKVKGGLKDYASAALNMDSILRGLDGYEDLGDVYQAIKAPIDRAAREELPKRQEEYGTKLAGIYNKHFTREEQRNLSKQEFMQLPDGRWLSREQALSVALNMGNEGNLEAVYSGVASAKEQLQPADIQSIKDSLSKADWEFVQDVWDMLDFELWPLVRDAHKNRTGVAPKKVDATPVVTAHGTYRGGYYPIKFDPGLSFRATEQQADEMAQQVKFGSFAKAQTRRGHTIERTNSGGNPLNYSLSVLHSHVEQALVDVTMGDAINDVSRIITHKDFVNAMQRTGNTWALKAMENWLKDTASQEVISSHFLSQAVRHIRVGFTMSKLSWNVGTILLQPFGLAQSIPDIGYQNMLHGMMAANPARWFGENNVFSQIEEKSPFMRTRGDSFNKDIRDTMTAMRGSGWMEAVLEKIPGVNRYSQQVAETVKQSLMGGIVATQRAVDGIVWMGAYQKGKQQFSSDSEAIQYADSMVARTQASGIFSDRTAFERGTIDNQTRQSEFVRLWTTMGSYMFAKGNIAYEKTANVDFRDPAQVLRWMHDMFMLFTFEAILIGLMRGFMPDEDDEETKAGFIAEETLYTVMGTMPIIREGASALSGFQGGGVLGSFWADAAKVKTQAAQGEVDAPLLKSLNNVGGTLFRYPSSQTNRVFESLWRDMNGEDVSIMDYLIYRQKDD